MIGFHPSEDQSSFKEKVLQGGDQSVTSEGSSRSTKPPLDGDRGFHLKDHLLNIKVSSAERLRPCLGLSSVLPLSLLSSNPHPVLAQ